MITLACPSCRKTLQLPEDQAGEPITCPHCNAPVRLSLQAQEGNNALPWILGILGLGVLGIFGCGMVIVVCLAAISVLGSNASAKFSTVAMTIGSGSPMLQQYTSRSGKW